MVVTKNNWSLTSDKYIYTQEAHFLVQSVTGDLANWCILLARAFNINTILTWPGMLMWLTFEQTNNPFITFCSCILVLDINDTNSVTVHFALIR